MEHLPTKLPKAPPNLCFPDAGAMGVEECPQVTSTRFEIGRRTHWNR